MSVQRTTWVDRAAAALKGWRADLDHEARAGDLAALRRLSDPADAMLLPCFAELCNRALAADDYDQRRLAVLARCALLAGRLSRFDRGTNLASAMARRSPGSQRPLISPVRAAGLFALEHGEQACLAIASMLGLLGGRASAQLDAYETVLGMDDWDRKRREIALAYYRAIAPSRGDAVAATVA